MAPAAVFISNRKFCMYVPAEFRRESLHSAWVYSHPVLSVVKKRKTSLSDRMHFCTAILCKFRCIQVRSIHAKTRNYVLRNNDMFWKQVIPVSSVFFLVQYKKIFHIHFSSFQLSGNNDWHFILPLLKKEPQEEYLFVRLIFTIVQILIVEK